MKHPPEIIKIIGNKPSGFRRTLSVYGLIFDDFTVGITDFSNAELLGWHKIGDLVGEDKFTYAYRNFLCTEIFTVEFLDDFYDELTSRTRSLTSGLLRDKHVGFIGCGTSLQLIEGCARCGVSNFSLWDFDTVELPNVGRTGYNLTDLGELKVRAAHRHILNINPEATVTEHQGDILELSAEEFKSQLKACDAVVVGTDNQNAQLQSNEIGYSLKKKMLFPGFYEQAAGGEIFVVTPETPCYRCQARSRFEESGETVDSDLPAETGLIFDCQHLDSLVGKLIVAMLLEDHLPFWREIYQHAIRNSFILVKNSPDFTLDGQDIFAELLGKGDFTSMFQTVCLNPESWRDEACPICGGKKKEVNNKPKPKRRKYAKRNKSDA